MDVGSIVKFRDGLYPSEEGCLYVVIEDNGDRVFIEYICNMHFPPQSVARTKDLEVVKLPSGREESGQNP